MMIKKIISKIATTAPQQIKEENSEWLNGNPFGSACLMVTGVERPNVFNEHSFCPLPHPPFLSIVEAVTVFSLSFIYLLLFLLPI